MPATPVRFRYYTGIKRDIFDNAFLVGSWDDAANPSETWSSRPMRKIAGEDGCPCFEATVDFDAAYARRPFRWGVRLDAPAGRGYWAIPTEWNSITDSRRDRSFVLGNQPQQENYYLTHCRRLGAQKRVLPGMNQPGIEFAVWAPNATSVEVVFADFDPNVQGRNGGYIADNGGGIDQTFVPNGSIALRKDSRTGIWYSAVQPDFARYQRKLYMFRITRQGGDTVYRTDIYSRHQIGHGRYDPQGQLYNGHFLDLDGTKSCSVVVDPDMVASWFSAPFGQEALISEEEFWRFT